MSLLPELLFREVEELPTSAQKQRWYNVVIVALSSMNYPDAIPQVWEHFLSYYIPTLPQTKRLLAARIIREALTKSLGIVGAAKVWVARAESSDLVV